MDTGIIKASTFDEKMGSVKKYKFYNLLWLFYSFHTQFFLNNTTDNDQ